MTLKVETDLDESEISQDASEASSPSRPGIPLTEERIKEFIGKGGASASPKRQITSPSATCRALLGTGRLKRPAEGANEFLNGEALKPEVEQAEAPETDEAGIRQAQETGRISNYFRKAVEESSANSTLEKQALLGMSSAQTNWTSKQMPRSSSAPSQGATHQRTDRQRNPLDGLVDVEIYFVQSSNRFTLRVRPDLHIGPDKPSSRKGADWKPTYDQSLKSMIEDASGIPVAKQMLFCHRCRMGQDRHTIRSYNAHHGGVEIQVRVSSTSNRPSVSHACTAKFRQLQAARLQQKERARNCSQQDAAVHSMPKWQSCVAPAVGTYFQYADRGMEGNLARMFDLQHNGDPPEVFVKTMGDPFIKFGDYHTWRPDVGDRRWDAIRASQTYTQPLQFEQT